MSIPTDILAQAEELGAEQDMMQEQAMTQMAPQGKFSMRALNQLVKELNVVLELFGETYPEFAEDITVFPEEFVTALSMVQSAAEDSEVGLELEFAEIKDDRDLAIIAGRLRKLGQSKEFQKFLADNSLTPEDEVMVEEEVVVEEAPVEDIEAMVAGRV